MAETECDRALVNDVLAGRDGAFVTLVERYQRLVWHLVFRMVQDAEDCRELHQEVFLRVHMKLRQFRFESTLGTWIGSIAYSICARHLERKRLPLMELSDGEVSSVDALADDFDVSAACADAELVAQLHAEIEALPPLHRTVITLYYLEEMTVSEVAAIVSKPEGTIKNLLFRARRHLRKRLNARQEASDDRPI